MFESCLLPIAVNGQDVSRDNNLSVGDWDVPSMVRINDSINLTVTESLTCSRVVLQATAKYEVYWEEVGAERFYIFRGHREPTDVSPASGLLELACCEAPISNREASSNGEASTPVGIPSVQRPAACI